MGSGEIRLGAFLTGDHKFLGENDFFIKPVIYDRKLEIVSQNIY